LRLGFAKSLPNFASNHLDTYMKKITLLTVCVFAVAIYSFGQFSKGSILAGGNVGADFSTNKTIAGSVTTTNYSTNSFSLSPQVGYFFIDNFVGGAGVKLFTSSQKIDSSPSAFSQTNISFEPFARYYFYKFYGQALIGFGSSSSEQTNNNGNVSTSKGSLFNWSISGGYAILLNDHVAIEPQIGYRSTSISPDGTNSTNRTAGIFIQLGFQIYIHK
jgi:outer membrane protein